MIENPESIKIKTNRFLGKSVILWKSSWAVLIIR